MKELIEKYKEKGTEDELIDIINRMMPLICKFAYRLDQYEFEDMKQELIIALIVAVKKIVIYENEGQCVKFLIRAIQNRFLELCRVYNKKKKETMLDKSMLENMLPDRNYYIDIDFYVDLEKMRQCNTEIKDKIWQCIVSEQNTDSEIASKLKVSRQYVNKCKKELFIELLKY